MTKFNDQHKKIVIRMEFIFSLFFAECLFNLHINSASFILEGKQIFEF